MRYHIFRHIKIRLITLAVVYSAILLTPVGIYAQTHISADPDTLRGATRQEITVRRTKEHYSKRNNPAVEFMNRIRTAKEASDPRRNDFYNYRKYERMSFGLNNFKMADSLPAGKKPGKFAFLKEHVDTSDISGVPVLPLSVKEKVTDVIYRRSPHSEKQYVRGQRSSGIDDIADFQNVQTMIEDVFREVDLYDDDITILRNRFVSPLSHIAPDFYKFYLTDTVTIEDGTRCIVLSFAPRNPATFGFLGRLYVAEGDSTMFVRRVSMGVSPSINLNFVDRMQILQEFAKAPDGSRLKLTDDLNVEMTVLPGSPPLYARRTTAYDNHNFAPSPQAELLDRLGSTFTAPDAGTLDEKWWGEHRLVAASSNETRIPQLLNRLRNVPIYKYGEKFLKLMVVGYVPTGKPSKFDIGPLNTFISGNSVEGVRLRAGGITTANLSNRWFARGYIAYGTRDHKWKYSAELEHSFNEKRYHSREFPIHSIKFCEKYDIDQLGQHYLFTNPDNMFLALKRGSNKLITYRRDTRLTYQLELANNFSVEASAGVERQEPGPFVPFVLTDGTHLDHINEATFTVQLRYAPGEKFYQGKTSRIPINHDPPVFILSHTFAPKGFLGSRYTINKTELSAQKRVWFSAFGFADIILKGGHIWSRSPYMALATPNANLSYTIQDESFALLNPMEFIGDSYVSWDLTYWANGALFNYIPLLKKLKLREVVAFRGWLGHLSDKNNPRFDTDRQNPLLMFPQEAADTPMHKLPYMEISAGIDNFLKVLRIDYVWRLNYRDTPGIDRSGLRIALHVTF